MLYWVRMFGDNELLTGSLRKGVHMARYAVIFPGVGYHTDKPLLYYGKMFARKNGYEIIEVPYGNFKKGIKGDVKKMREAFESAFAQTEEILRDVRWDEAEDILFISKSIGTIVAAVYERKKNLSVRHVYFTPLKETFQEARGGNGIAFHGTADPWASDADIAEGCREKDIEYFEIPDANHSLETGDAINDLKNLTRVMMDMRDWLAKTGNK